VESRPRSRSRWGAAPPGSRAATSWTTSWPWTCDLPPRARRAAAGVRARAPKSRAFANRCDIVFLSCRATVHEAGGCSPARSALTARVPCAADCGFVGCDGGRIYGDACLWGSVGAVRAAGEAVGGRAGDKNASLGISKGGSSQRPSPTTAQI